MLRPDRQSQESSRSHLVGGAGNVVSLAVVMLVPWRSTAHHAARNGSDAHIVERGDIQAVKHCRFGRYIHTIDNRSKCAIARNLHGIRACYARRM